MSEAIYFSDKAIKALKPEPKRYVIRELNGKGFAIRVSTSGTKTFVFIYQFQGKRRQMSLGEYPHTSLADAHEAHFKARTLLKKERVDPALVDKNAQTGEGVTVRAMAEEFLAHHPQDWAPAPYPASAGFLLPKPHRAMRFQMKRPRQGKLDEGAGGYSSLEISTSDLNTFRASYQRSRRRDFSQTSRRR